MVESVFVNKAWWRSKTVWVSVLMFLIWVLSVVEGLTDNHLYTAILAFITMLLGLILRFLTGKPIALKDLVMLVDAAGKIHDAAEAKSNPSIAKPVPWPPPNMDGTPFENKPGPPPGYIEKE